MTIKFLLLAVFGIAMAHLEGVVVFYLRSTLGVVNSYSNRKVLERFSKRYLYIEKSREVSTIIMLLVLSYLVSTSLLDFIMVFLWTFATWDLFYYLSLYILLKWPPDLKTMDVLFLIPRPWIAPVWLPIGISSLTIILIAVFYLIL